jgi:hypothetical protein
MGGRQSQCPLITGHFSALASRLVGEAAWSTLPMTQLIRRKREAAPVSARLKRVHARLDAV